VQKVCVARAFDVSKNMQADPPRSNSNFHFLRNAPNLSQFGVSGVRGFNRPLTTMDAVPFDTRDMKFFDCILGPTLIDSCTDGTWDGPGIILDPDYVIHSLRSFPVDGNVPAPETLFAPQLMYPVQPEDNDELGSCRIGRSVYLHGISVRGEVLRDIATTTSEYVGSLAEPGVVRLLLVVDRQSNQVQLSPYPPVSDPSGSLVIQDSIYYDSSGDPQRYAFNGPNLYNPLYTGARERIILLDEVFIKCRPGTPILRTLPTTLEVGVDTTSTATTTISGTSSGTVALTAGTGGPISLANVGSETTDTVAATTGTVSGVILPDFSVGGFREPFELNYFFKEPLKVDFDIMYTALPNKSTGTILDCPSLSFHILGARDTYPVAPRITYFSRCWFTDV